MIVGAVGVCRSGKTYGMQRMVAAELRQGASPWRIVILDVNREWPGEPARGAPPIRFVVASSAGQVARALVSGERAVLVRPPFGTVGESARDRAFADDLARVAIQHPGPVALAIPEVHRYLEEGAKAPPHLRTVIHQHRHTRTGLLWDTQQFADVRKELLRETTYGLRLYAQVHASSLKRVREEYGPRAVALLREAARRMRAGERGWHVHWLPGMHDDELTLVR